MKILISAYACEPNKGSEPGIGWNWMINLVKKGHSVTVITRKNNKKIILKTLKAKKLVKKIDFIFFDCHDYFLKLKKIIPGGVYFYYYIWQYKLFKYLEKKPNIKKYDLIHHLTFGVIRLPSFLWKLKKPFIFGPVGGGEKTHFILDHDLTFQEKFKEYLRNFSNYLFLNFDRNLKNCLDNSQLIFTKTNETKNLLNKKYKSKTNTCLELGIDKSVKKNVKKSKLFKILYVGRHIYWKGGELLIRSFHKSLKKNQNLHLTFVGDGQDKDKWIKLTEKLQISNKVSFKNAVKQDRLKKIFLNNDILIFPSFHDSSGNVVLEALSNSLPVICLKLGGPWTILDRHSGFAIDLNKITSYQHLVSKISNKIIFFSKNYTEYKRFSKNAYYRSKYFHWSLVLDRIYSLISKKIP